MIKKITITLLSIFVVLAGVAFYCTPYLTYRNIRIAAEQRDAKAMSKYIEFSSLKKSLKENIKSKLEVTEKKNGEQGEGIGAAMVSALITPLIDAFITPETIGLMLKGSTPSLKKRKDQAAGKKEKEEHAGDTKNRRDAGSPDILMYYESLNRFVVEIKKKGAGEEPIALLFRRHQLLYWKLYAIKLP
jgi:hypothetical protein